MNRKLSHTALIVTQLCVAACYREIHPIHAEPGEGFALVFNGFVYVGMDVDENSHTNSGLEMPSRVSPGHEYVFHHTKPFDSLEFARTKLPPRLQNLASRVTQDVDHGSIVFVDPGGVLWSVKFARGGCTGIIAAHRCMDLTSRKPFKDTRFGESDFVLTLNGQCPP